MHESVTALLTALVLNGVIALIVYVSFYFAKPRAPKVFLALARLIPQVFNSVPKAAPLTLDAEFFLIFLRTCLYLFAAVSMVCLPLLLPVNAVNQRNLPGLDLLSLSNVSDSSRTWAHFLVTLIISAAGLYGLYYRTTEYNSLRATFLKVHASRTILLEDVPAAAMTDSKMVETFPSSLKTRFHRNASALAKPIIERAKLVEKIEKVAYAKPGKNGEAPCHRPKIFFGEKVDSLSHHIKELVKLDDKIAAKQDEALAQAPSEPGTCFVTFANAASAVRACSSNPKSAAGVVRSINPVGSPNEDVYWPNVGVVGAVLFSRKIASFGITVFLLIFWVAIVAFIGAISRLSTLTELIPPLEGPINSIPPVALGLIEGYLPIIAVAVFMSLLPMYLLLLAQLAGLAVWLDIKARVQTVYFWFLVLNVFLVTTLSGSILSTAQQIIDKPVDALELLGQSIPSSSNFFINYILLQALVGPALELLQVTRLVVQPLMVKLGLAKTPRALNLLYRAPYIDYSLRYPLLSLVVLLGLIFSVIAPIILVPVVMLFAIVLVIYQRNLANVYDNSQPDSGGKFYAISLGHLHSALCFFQAVVFAIFILKESWPQAGILGAAFIATLVSKIWIKCKPDCELVDIVEGEVSPDGGIASVETDFVHPNLKNVLEGVWIEDKPEQEKVLVERGVAVISSTPRILVPGGGKKPDILSRAEAVKEGMTEIDLFADSKV